MLLIIRMKKELARKGGKKTEERIMYRKIASVNINVNGFRGSNWMVTFYGKKGTYFVNSHNKTSGNGNKDSLLGLLAALKQVTPKENKPVKVTVNCRRAFLINAFAKNYVKNWEEKHWRKADRTHIAYADLYQDILCEVDRIKKNGSTIVWNQVERAGTTPYKSWIDYRTIKVAKEA